jgi:beta-lactam-binding protein with PASTA domain
VVPAVKGLTLAAAKRRLRAANCGVKVTRRRAARSKRGKVISQSARAKKRYAAGHRVTLVVGR